METIQKIIEKKAEQKLEADIKEYLERVREDRFFMPLREQEVHPQKQKFWSFFWISRDAAEGAFGILKKALLPQYIAHESQEFMEKVERVSAELEELKEYRNGGRE